jgi:predicted nucleic acid-binding protein
VIRAETKYVLDTNLFIDAFRDQSTNIELQGFHEAFAPFEYLSSVVVQELRAGARSGEDLRKLERNVLDPFIDIGRLVTPSFRAWQKSGDVLARLAQTERLNLGSVTKAFGSDILLALSCREVGMTLVTRNTRDFARIQRVVPFRFVAPWPPPAR